MRKILFPFIALLLLVGLTNLWSDETMPVSEDQTKQTEVSKETNPNSNADTVKQMKEGGTHTGGAIGEKRRQERHEMNDARHEMHDKAKEMHEHSKDMHEHAKDMKKMRKHMKKPSEMMGKEKHEEMKEKGKHKHNR